MALHGGIALLLMTVPTLLILSAIVREVSMTLLCTDCRQCTEVCPVVTIARELDNKEGDGRTTFIGPAEVMRSLRAGHDKRIMEGGLQICSTCRDCVERCPRGLDAEAMVLAGRSIRFGKEGATDGQVKLLERLDKARNALGETKNRPDPDSQARSILRRAKQLERHLEDNEHGISSADGPEPILDKDVDGTDDTNDVKVESEPERMLEEKETVKPNKGSKSEGLKKPVNTKASKRSAKKNTGERKRSTGY